MTQKLWKFPAASHRLYDLSDFTNTISNSLMTPVACFSTDTVQLQSLPLPNQMLTLTSHRSCKKPVKLR